MVDLTKKGIDPQILQIVLLDELCGRMEELSESQKAYNKYQGPMKRPFRRELRYQYATILAGGQGRVYYLPNLRGDVLVGLITQVGNNWFPNTYLEWRIDGFPTRIEHVIGDINNPKEYLKEIPFQHEVEWIAYNNDGVDHTFAVLCDGYFITRELYDKIVE